MNKLLQVYTILILISLTATETSLAAPTYAKTGCDDRCGTVRIPYPFGIGANCSVNKWYTVDCNSSTPYLSALNQLQILAVDLENQTFTVNTPMISDCSHTSSIDLGESPFVYSKAKNKFVFEGCGNAVMMDHGNMLTGCSTTCRNDSVSDKKNCLGIRCCQTSIPYHLKAYNMNLTGLKRQGGDRACRSALFVDNHSYVEGRFKFSSNDSYVPISLLWTLSDSDSKKVNCCTFSYPVEVDLANGKSVRSWKCDYDRTFYLELQGNAYLSDPNLCITCKSYGQTHTQWGSGFEPASLVSTRLVLPLKQTFQKKKSDGCQYIDGCKKCYASGGECSYDEILDGDNNSIIKRIYTCKNTYNHESKSSLGVILGVSVSMGVLLLVATIYALYKWIKKTKERRQRKRFFKHNGGLLLKQQEEADPSLVEKIILFTSRELEKATDNFNENRILGRGGQGTVYKGMLVDGKIVAVKKSKKIDESQLDQFINEVVILSQVNHRNVVKLLGCCLETEVPLLVSEFIPNGTLYDHLHKETHEFPFSLNIRLQIATEVAGALAYLHSSTSIPIYHRDIKTSNILLDEKYRAKVSDFGTSRFVSMDQTHLTTLVKGTFGYLDPEYFRSSQFTEKSDVYSFGVVLVELLTGERPISQIRPDEHRSLATHFMLAMEEGCVLSIYDATILKEGTKDDLMALANLAVRCLNMNGKHRPSMKQVATELEIIRTSHIPLMAQK